MVLVEEGAQHTQGFNKHVWHERVRGQWGMRVLVDLYVRRSSLGAWVRVSLGGACMCV